MNPSKWIGAVASAVVAAVLPACDAVNLQELKPGVSTASEVRDRMGPPAIEHDNPDGSVTYEYSRQPNGTHCYMITIGKDEVVQRIEQVLTEANLARVQPGMTRNEVRRLLGAPGLVTQFPAMREEVWDWRVAGVIPTEEAHFHAHFDVDSGLVTKTSRRVEAKG
jgi:outer membrane protein assembly factor BamE (lipoprotein component of BamABCDE complex)